MAESQLVTVAGINKVWSATMALYNKLDHRLDDIGNIYRFQGTKSNWTQFKTDVTSASKGDAWVIDSDYKEFPEDPINYPAYQSGDPGRVHICIQDYTSVSITDDNWYEYWNPVDLNLAVATDNTYGVVKLGYFSDTSGTKVDISNGNLYVPLYDIEKGNNITIDSPTTSNSKKIHADIYKSISGRGINIVDGTTSDNITTRIVRNTGLTGGITDKNKLFLGFQ